MEESSLRNAAWRFRKRFSELFRNRVSATVDDPNSIEDEIQSLKAALAALSLATFATILRTPDIVELRWR